MKYHVLCWVGSLAIAMAAAKTDAADASAPDKAMLGSHALTTGIPGDGALTLDQIDAWLADPRNHAPLAVELPLGLVAGQSQIVIPSDNPLTRAKIELGRQLYFDPRLSSDGTISCSSCHHPDEGYGRHETFGIGVGGQSGNRNSPVSYNRILSAAQFWDGRAASLEEQAKGPIANPIEMANTHEVCVATLKTIPGYVHQFEAVFGGDGISIDHVAKAIASFERCLVTGPSPFDYYEQLKPYAAFSADDIELLKEDDPDLYAAYERAKSQSEAHPMSASAQRGRDLFFSQRVNCSACHVGANLADEKYHNLGVGADAAAPDVGRYAVTGDPKDWGAFKTPTIRNVESSAPYMHDGGLATLEEVVEHYNKGGAPNKNLSDKIVKLNLTDQEKEDLVEFMKACTGDMPAVETARLP